MSVGTYRPITGECVLAYLDGARLARTMCWIVREDEPDKYIALMRITRDGDPLEYRLESVAGVAPFSLQEASGADLDSRNVRIAVSAAIRALAPFMR